jgi:putative membrane protein
MQLAVKIFIGTIAFLHLYFLYFEMFAWTNKGPKIFRGFPKEFFPKTKAMAANQGLYNGFLAAGLIWTFFIDSPEWQTNIALFFLSCVAIAGSYGAISVSKKIFLIQALPAIVAMVLLLFL